MLLIPELRKSRKSEIFYGVNFLAISLPENLAQAKLFWPGIISILLYGIDHFLLRRQFLALFVHNHFRFI